MRPTTPKFNFAPQAGPSSPPATPTTTTFNFNTKNRRHGVANFSRSILTQDLHGAIIPNGNGPTFSYNPFQVLDLELSPRSSSPASSERSSISSTSTSVQNDSPRPRSRSSSPGETFRDSKPQVRTRIVAEGNFTLEEFDEEDYDAFDSDTESIIRPHQYEDAESERARSTKGTSPNRELDPRILHGLSNLQCAQPESEETDAFEERELWLEKQREERRRKRRSSSSVQKRSLAQSIGSDTDDEDIQPFFEGVNEAGSSARRLRRKVGERVSLIFDDPPPRIDELEEPESCEEVVSIEEGEDEDSEGQDLARELPYYVQDMDVDSSDEDSDDD